MNKQLKLLKFQGLNNMFIALCKSEEQYYVLYGNIKEPHICATNDSVTIEDRWSFDLTNKFL